MINKTIFSQVAIVKNRPLLRRQKGLVLFIALIALVAMSLAAAALIRSVDSGVLVAGNLAFKQSAIMSAETGIARAYRFINDNDEAALFVPTTGYYANFDGVLLESSASLNAAATWNNSIKVDNDIADKSGNETRLILQRMCRNPGAKDKENCLVGTGNSTANSMAGKSEGGTNSYCQTCKNPEDAVVYRATVRVTGPKNTVSYLQAFIY
ncbi:pilus assembly PilX family protein [Methylotenera versatilis]|uniref:pilus assembly PilX family protein n=1 Tax=Methylotenera versatilis TaxID=1055487 RepID=UPI0006464963|nr:hypothetical protein [Methylotenera versatilis]